MGYRGKKKPRFLLPLGACLQGSPSSPLQLCAGHGAGWASSCVPDEPPQGRQHLCPGDDAMQGRCPRSSQGHPCSLPVADPRRWPGRTRGFFWRDPEFPSCSGAEPPAKHQLLEEQSPAGDTWQELTSSPLINGSRRGSGAKPNPPAAVAGAARAVRSVNPIPTPTFMGRNHLD